MKSRITCTMAGVLLALSASAQEGPIRIQPAPLPGLPVRGIEVEPAQPPPDFAPGEDFPVPSEMPPDAWGEPGFGGEMIMHAMPGRFQIISAQIQQAGKSVPVVLKLDTQTGEVWQLKLTESKYFVNGKVQVRTQMNFEPLGQNRESRRGRGRGFIPGRPDIDRDEPDAEEVVPDRPRFRPRPVPVRPDRDAQPDGGEEAVPDRPRFRPRPAPVRPEPGRRNLIEPETETEPAPRPGRRAPRPGR